MNLSPEREKEIRDAVPYLLPANFTHELLAEIDRLRAESVRELWEKSKIIVERDQLREKLEVAAEVLEELYIPYKPFSPKTTPRFPEVILKEALPKIRGEKW